MGIDKMDSNYGNFVVFSSNHYKGNKFFNRNIILRDTNDSIIFQLFFLVLLVSLLLNVSFIKLNYPENTFKILRIRCKIKISVIKIIFF